MWRHDSQECIVVDCSRVSSPHELCQRFRDLLRVRVAPEEDTAAVLALSLRTARAVHLSPRFELHGVETLVASGHSGLVAALEDLGRKLEEEGTAAQLSVIKRGPPPRGRLFQHSAFRFVDLQGYAIEAARYWRGMSGRANACSILWIKPREHQWQRFFLDAGGAFWEEWDDETTLRDFEELQEEMCELDSLRGLVLGEVEAAPFGAGSSALRIGLGEDGALWLVPVEPHRLETDAVLLTTVPTR